MEEKIIEFVRNNRILYDNTEPGFKDLYLKEERWTLLAKELNTTTLDVKERWKTLRAYYARVIKKKQTASEINTKSNKPWKYLSSMHFLGDRQRADIKCIKSSTEKCRICLVETNNPLTDLKNVFNNFVDGENFYQIYEYCIGTALDTDISGLSNDICEKCETNLVNSFEFKKQCLETERVILNQFKNERLKSEISDVDNLEQKIRKPIELGEDSILGNFTSDNSFANHTQDHGKSVENETKTNRLEISIPNYLKLTTLCSICGNLVKNVYLKRHLEGHENKTNDQKRFPCATCGAVYKTKPAMQHHQRKHTNDKRYACPYCDKKFMDWSTKTRHVSFYHTGEAKFTCMVCNAKFCLSGPYKIHLKSHTGGVERTKSCNVCGKLFATNYRLKLHQVTHTDERNVKCDQCGKTLKHKKNLLVHMRSHTGEKNYECPVCSMAFIQNLQLKNHVKKEHPDYQLPAAGTVVNKSFLEKLSARKV